MRLAFSHNLSSLRSFSSLALSSRKVAHKRPPPPRFRLSIVHRGPVIYSFCERRKRRARFIRGNNGHGATRGLQRAGIPFIRASRDFPREKLGSSVLRLGRTQRENKSEPVSMRPEFFPSRDSPLFRARFPIRRRLSVAFQRVVSRRGKVDLFFFLSPRDTREFCICSDSDRAKEEEEQPRPSKLPFEPPPPSCPPLPT